MVEVCWQLATEKPEEPLLPAEDLYGIVGADLKKTYDIREVRKKHATLGDT